MIAASVGSMIATAVAVLAGYLIGTFPSAVLIAGRRNLDIEASGSGNPGASNIARTLGWRAGLVVFALDAAKGAVAAGIGWWLLGRPGAYLIGAAAILGHLFPIGRRGGKGVATGAGVLAVVHPILVPLVLGVWWIAGRLSGTASIASAAAAITVPVTLIAVGTPPLEVLATVGIVAMILLRHVGNFRRLATGSEHRLRIGAGERR